MKAKAQEKFALMLKNRIAPALRTEGFRGTGTSYSKPNSEYFILVGFQKSSANTAESVKFTINLGVINKEVWSLEFQAKPYVGEHPKANVFNGAPFWQKRIGELTKNGNDLWWVIDSNTDTSELANEVLETLSTSAFPAINAQLIT